MGTDNVNPIPDVSAGDVWSRLSSRPDAVLIDVRTRAEWNFVGLPDLAAVGRKPVLVEWQTFPDSKVDPQFALRLTEALTALGAGKDSELYFICRSGGRSRSAAQAMAAAGFTRCHNVAEGFEGALDADRHRGRVGGWKAAGLPWAQG